MLGRMRAAPSPVEWLELERPHPKLLKDDSLSVYEATLAKMRQGSQRSLIAEPNSMDVESSGNVSSDELSGVSVLCGEQGVATSGSGSDSSGTSVSSYPNQEPKRGREVSIHYLFSKYATSHHNQGSASSSGSPVSVVSASLSESDSPGCSKLQF